MKTKHFSIGINFLFIAFAAAFASLIPFVLADGRSAEGINQVTPVFGVAIGIVLVGGYRYFPAIFIGAVIPLAFVGDNLQFILSVPLASLAAASVARQVLLAFRVRLAMDRAKDAFLVLFWSAGVASLLGALVQSAFLCTAPGAIPWREFPQLAGSNWLAAAVGVVVVAPFIQAWASPESFHLKSRQLLEVLLWFLALISFGHVTLRNWAPTDTLLYPMELAIFPIMAWAAFRFGLRGASAGVLALALLAAWEFAYAMQGQGGAINESPVNVWVFVGIVSVTSICLAAVMTELRVREARTSENERRLRAFTDALPDIAFVFGSDGLIHDVFAASAKICANHRIFNADSVRGKKISDLFDDLVCERFMTTIRTALENDRVSTLEYSLQSVDVGEHWFEARVTPMLSEDSHNEQVVWVAYNISSRKLVEDALIQRDRVLKATANANNSLLTSSEFDFGVNAALSEIGSALGVDRAFIFKFSGSEMEEFHHLAIVHEWIKTDSIARLSANPILQDAPCEEYCPDWYERLLEKGIVKIDAENCLEQDNEVLQIFQTRAILAIPMLQAGEVYGFFGVDHTQRSHLWGENEINAVRLLASGLSGLLLIRKHQNHLQHAKESANAASHAKGEFLAIMSHEIRTPMNSIIGYTDLLSQSELGEPQSEYASIIKRSGHALLDLINNILDYSKIESCSFELETESFHLEQTILEAVEEMLPQARDKTLELNYEIDSNAKELYIGDPQRLRQILLNLISNGIKFSRKGSVRVKASLHTIDLEHSEDVIHFQVTDAGTGIPIEKQHKIFQPYSQADSSTSRTFGGTGLGLAIAKHLVELMHGKIWVESAPGEGSNFQFHIRLKHAACDPANAASQNGDGHQQNDSDRLNPEFAMQYPLNLLVCEDDKGNRRVIRTLLEKLGYRAALVESSEEALIQLQHRSYDAVLMDVRLPGRSGIEMTQAIRSGKEQIGNQNQYIIAITAYAMKEDREKCLRAGMNDYIRKPIEISELKEALKRANQAAAG